MLPQVCWSVSADFATCLAVEPRLCWPIGRLTSAVEEGRAAHSSIPMTSLPLCLSTSFVLPLSLASSTYLLCPCDNSCTTVLVEPTPVFLYRVPFPQIYQIFRTPHTRWATPLRTGHYQKGLETRQQRSAARLSIMGNEVSALDCSACTPGSAPSETAPPTSTQNFRLSRAIWLAATNPWHLQHDLFAVCLTARVTAQMISISSSTQINAALVIRAESVSSVLETI